MRAFDWGYYFEVFPKILGELPTTLLIALCSLGIGLLLAVLLALGKNSKIKIVKALCTVYVSFFRATPLLVQIFFLYYGLATFIPAFQKISGFSAIIITMGLHISAYMAEIIRAAITSVDRGQHEAGFSIGMNKLQIFIRIVFPQAARIAIPGLANCFIDLVKGSSLAFTIGVMEMMARTQVEGAATYKYFECYAVAMVIYWVVVLIFEQFQKLLEKKLNQAY